MRCLQNQSIRFIARIKNAWQDSFVILMWVIQVDRRGQVLSVGPGVRARNRQGRS